MEYSPVCATATRKPFASVIRSLLLYLLSYLLNQEMPYSHDRFSLAIPKSVQMIPILQTVTVLSHHASWHSPAQARQPAA